MKHILLFILIVFSLQIFAQTNMEIKTEQVAHYPAGDNDFFMLIHKKMKFSEEAKLDKLDAKLLVTFDVDVDSTISNVVFLNKAGYGVENDLEKLLTSLKFAPKIMNGRKFKSNVMYTIPVVAK